LYINQGSIPVEYFFTYWFRVIWVLVFLESSIATGYKELKEYEPRVQEISQLMYEHFWRPF